MYVFHLIGTYVSHHLFFLLLGRKVFLKMFLFSSPHSLNPGSGTDIMKDKTIAQLKTCLEMILRQRAPCTCRIKRCVWDARALARSLVIDAACAFSITQMLTLARTYTLGHIYMHMYTYSHTIILNP
jgi:hypothetical protein